MSSQIPFTPLTPEALAHMAPDEYQAFREAVEMISLDLKPSLEVTVMLVTTVHRLITAKAGAATVLGAVQSERDELCKQADAFRDAADFERNQVISLRALVAEMIDDFEHVVIHGKAGYVDRDMLDGYRERAGIEA